MYKFNPDDKYTRYDEDKMCNLVGKCIREIFINETHLAFITDEGMVTYMVEGDCCSHSYFHDFIGVKNLINKRVIAVEQIPSEDITDQVNALLPPKKDEYEYREGEEECLQHYGYRIVTEHEEFGEVSSVVSFRNSSNGYYSGSLEECEALTSKQLQAMQNITDDWVVD